MVHACKLCMYVSYHIASLVKVESTYKSLSLQLYHSCINPFVRNENENKNEIVSGVVMCKWVRPSDGLDKAGGMVG